MRIFKDDNLDGAVQKIVGEMLNLESGKLMYKNGIAVPEESQREYPKIKKGNIRIVGKFNSGIIIVPFDEDISQFRRLIINKIKDLEPPNHLKFNSPLEKYTNQFLAVVADNNMTGISISINVAFYKRRLCICRNISDILAAYPRSRFVWNIIGLRSYLDMIRLSNRCLLSCLSTIVWDKADKVRLAHNAYSMRLLDFDRFKINAQLHSLVNNAGHNIESLVIGPKMKFLDIILYQALAKRNALGAFKKTVMYKKVSNVYCQEWPIVSKNYKFLEPGTDTMSDSIPSACFTCSAELYEDIYVLIDGHRHYTSIYTNTTKFSPERAGLICINCLHIALIEENNSQFAIRTTYPRSREEAIGLINDEFTRSFVQSLKSMIDYKDFGYSSVPAQIRCDDAIYKFHRNENDFNYGCLLNSLNEKDTYICGSVRYLKERAW